MPAATVFSDLKIQYEVLPACPIVIPTHQGRAAEKILFSILGGKGKYFVSNTLFDTTRANIEFSGAEGIDCLCEEGKHPTIPAPFKGNMDVEALKKLIKEKGAENIPMVIITVTNNSGGGQPVSMQNIREVRKICNENNIPLFIDACRFAENSYFIKLREEGYADKPVPEIANELFSYADGCTMSAKKDAFANIGGFLAMHDWNWLSNAGTCSSSQKVLQLMADLQAVTLKPLPSD